MIRGGKAYPFGLIRLHTVPSISSSARVAAQHSVGTFPGPHVYDGAVFDCRPFVEFSPHFVVFLFVGFREFSSLMSPFVPIVAMILLSSFIALR